MYIIIYTAASASYKVHKTAAYTRLNNARAQSSATSPMPLSVSRPPVISVSVTLASL